MTETDVDTQSQAALNEEEANARLPWESIDPDEHPADFVSPFASAATIAAEAKEASAPPVSPLLLNEFSVLENEIASTVSPEEREEQLADRAFFSDEKISIETMGNAPEMAGVSAPAILGLAQGPVVDPFSYDLPAQQGKNATPANSHSGQGRGTGGPPVNSENDRFVASEKSPVVSRTIPADAVQENAITFSSTESLQSAASELATLSESFGPAIELEQSGDQTILVTVSKGDHLSGLTDVQPLLAVQPGISTESEVELDEEIGAPVSTTGGGWTTPLMCLGIGLIACCMVIPQGEANRRLRYEQAALAADLQNVQKQAAVNDEFLKKVSDDPTLAERLAGRQMKTIRKGQTVIDLKQSPADDDDMSPFSLVAVAKPADLPPYKPKSGTIANLCNNARSRLYLLGAAMGMVAVGLVMGFGAKKDE